MINFRNSDIPASYEPVIVDHHSISDEHGTNKIPAKKIADSFTDLMLSLGYSVYGTSHISPDHIQMVYLSKERSAQAREDFLQSDRNSVGSCFGFPPRPLRHEH